MNFLFEQEYFKILSRIRSFLATTRSLSTLTECERLLGDARRCAHAMQGIAEVSNDPLKVQTAKTRLEKEIPPLADEISRSLAEKQQGNYNPSRSRQELFSGPSNNGSGAIYEQGSDTERLIRYSENLLKDSQKVCYETQQISAGTLQQMHRQRELIQHASGLLGNTIYYTKEASQLIQEMSRRAFRNRLFLYGVIALLVLADGYLIYRRLVKK